MEKHKHSVCSFGCPLCILEGRRQAFQEAVTAWTHYAHDRTYTAFLVQELNLAEKKSKYKSALRADPSIHINADGEEFEVGQLAGVELIHVRDVLGERFLIEFDASELHISEFTHSGLGFDKFPGRKFGQIILDKNKKAKKK